MFHFHFPEPLLQRQVFRQADLRGSRSGRGCSYRFRTAQGLSSPAIDDVFTNAQQAGNLRNRTSSNVKTANRTEKLDHLNSPSFLECAYLVPISQTSYCFY